MARSRYQLFKNQKPYFLTGTIVAWLPVFSYPRFVEIILDSWRFLQNDRRISIYGFVIMENHLHWIAAGEDLAKCAQYFKSYTARQIIDTLHQSGFETLLEELKFFKLRHKEKQHFQFWQEGNHPIEIQNPNIMRQKLDYIHQNPVRRGYVSDPTHWRYSSAANYTGLDGVIEVEMNWE
jgi:putative transposase